MNATAEQISEQARVISQQAEAIANALGADAARHLGRHNHHQWSLRWEGVPDVRTGDLLFTYHWDDGAEDGWSYRSWFNVTRADPKILVSIDLLAKLEERPATGHECEMSLDMEPALKLDPTVKGCEVWHLGTCYFGAVLRIQPREGQSYVYEIGQYDPKRHAWWAAWPD
jgi:hypothetical protein